MKEHFKIKDIESSAIKTLFVAAVTKAKLQVISNGI